MGFIVSQSIDLDFKNLSYLRSFIEAHRDEKFPLVGTTTDGDDVVISAVNDNVDVAYYRKDKNMAEHHTYWLDGEVELWFD